MLLTIEYWAFEVTNESQEKRLFLRSQFVEACFSPAGSDVGFCQTLLQVGLQPLVWGLELSIGPCPFPPKFPPRLLGRIIVAGDGRCFTRSSAIFVVGDVPNEVAVLTGVLVVVLNRVVLLAESWFGSTIAVIVCRHCEN